MTRLRVFLLSFCQCILCLVVSIDPPNTNFDGFMCTFDDILSLLNSQKKLCYIAGNFNIDILKHESHSLTADFINCIFSQSFFPLINRPTRITCQSATLIDNIFTNDMCLPCAYLVWPCLEVNPHDKA